MWSKGRRFNYSEDNEKPITFNNYTEYIKKQFLISNSLLKKVNTSRLEEALLTKKKKLPKRKKVKSNQVSPSKYEVNNGEGSPSYNQEGPETDEDMRGRFSPNSPEAKRMKILAAYGRSKSMNNIGNKVMPEQPSSPMLSLSPPGPATYHQPSSFIKPSFNRMFSDPNYPEGRDYSNNNEHKFIAYTDNNGKHSSTFAGSPQGGIFIKRSKSSDKVKCKVNSNNVGKRPPSPSKGFASRSSPKVNVSQHNPALVNRRYPPESDKLMKRWTSISRDTYKRWQAPGKSRPSSPSYHR